MLSGNIVRLNSASPAYSNYSENDCPDYLHLWRAWEKSAEPGNGEFRSIAVERLISCLENKSDLLNLSDLELSSVPDKLPAQIKTLILTNNQLTSLPDKLPASLQSLYIDNNPLTEHTLQNIQALFTPTLSPTPVIHYQSSSGSHGEAFPLISDNDNTLQEVLSDGCKIRLKVEDEIRYRNRMSRILTSPPVKITSGIIAGITLLTGATAFLRSHWNSSTTGGDGSVANALLSVNPEYGTSLMTYGVPEMTPSGVMTPQPEWLTSTPTAKVSVADFFKNEDLGFVDGQPTKEALASCVADWLFYPDERNASGNNVIRLARHILLVSGLYGGKEGETLSLRTAKGVVRQWVIHSLLNKSLREYIAEKLFNDERGEYINFGHLKKIINLPLLFLNGKIKIENIPAVKLDIFTAMWRAYMNAEIPLLYNKKFNEALSKPINEYEFLSLYTGMEYLAAQGTLDNFTLKEITETGSAIWGNMISGTNGSEMLPWIMTSAYFYAARTQPGLFKSQILPDAHAIINIVLNQWRNAQDQASKIQGAITAYQHALEVWSNKGALADKYIARCPLDKIHYAGNWGDDNLSQQEVNKKIRSGAKERYLLYDVAPCFQDDVPSSLSHEYNRVTENVAGAFKKLDRILLEGALFSASKDDYDFICSPTSTSHPAFLRMRTETPTEIQAPTVFGGATYAANIFVQLRDTELFAIIDNNEERIYGLKKNEGDNNGYRLCRLDRDVQLYIENDVLSHQYFWDLYSRSGDTIKARGYKFNFAIRVKEEVILYPKNGPGSEAFTDFFSEQHRQNFFTTLYNSGNDRSATENFWSALKPIIPFYGCVEGLAYGESLQIAQAVFSCLLDILSLIPVVGQATAISGKFGLGLVQGIRSGVLKTGQGATSKAIASAIAAGIALPAPAEIQKIIINILKAMDPGIELLLRGGAQIAHLSAAVSDPNLAAKLKELAAAQSALPKMEYRSARLPGNSAEINIKQIGENAWVRVNPQTGEGFGKYYSLAGNELEEIKVLSYRRPDAQPAGSQLWQPVLDPIPVPVEYCQLPQTPGNIAYWNTVREVRNWRPRIIKQPSPDNTLQKLKGFLPEVPLWVSTLESANEVLLSDISSFFAPYSWHAWPGMKTDASLNAPPWVIQMQETLHTQAEQSLQTFHLVWRMLWRIECFGGLMNSKVGHYLSDMLKTYNPQVISESFTRLKNIVKRSYKYLKAAAEVDFNNIIILSSYLHIDPEQPSRYISMLPDNKIKEVLPDAIVLKSDPESRIFFFADRQFSKIIDDASLSHHLNHEVTHTASNTDDIFLHFYPETGVIQNGKEVREDFYDNFRLRKEADALSIIYEKPEFNEFLCNLLITQEIKGAISEGDIRHAVFNDDMLRANLMMSDAEIIATIVRDLAEDRAFDAAIRTTRDSGAQSDAVSTPERKVNWLALTIYKSLRSGNYTAIA